MSTKDLGSLSKMGRRDFLKKIVVGGGVASVMMGSRRSATVAAAASNQPGLATSAPKSPATVEFWQIAQGPNFQAVMTQAIRDFQEKFSNIKVVLNEQPTLDLRTKLQTIFTSGGPGPDVVFEGVPTTLTYAALPLGFMDITDRIKAAGMEGKILQAVWPPVTKEGKHLGLPFAAYPYFLMYNKQMYESLGLKLPNTQDELLTVVKKMVAPAKDTFGLITFTNRFVAWILENLWYNAKVGYFQGSENFTAYDVTKPLTINTPKAVAALEYLRKLAETAPGGIKGNFGLGTEDARARFARGNIGHLYIHTIHVSQVVNDNPKMEPRKTFDIMVLPKGPDRRGLPVATQVLGMSKQSKDPDAAWELVKFLS